MRRVSLYSSSSDPSRRRPAREADGREATGTVAAAVETGAPPLPSSPPGPASAATPAGAPPGSAPRPSPVPTAGSRLRRSWRRHPHALTLAACLLTVLFALFAYHRLVPAPRVVADEHIEKLVLRTIERKALAAPTAHAFRVIAPSVVRVRGYGEAHKGKGRGKAADEALSIGSGVVIVDRGVILTSLHVVAGAPRLKVTFADGLESDAELVGARPDQDLAVIQAATIPDDLVAATMRSSSDLALGQPVAAVGFPFDVGLTVTEGVVSGLGREFRTPGGRMPLRDLIQFDAAVNPGSSGGPLITMDGEVVGIVTGILNPTDEGFFVGIGFAVPIESAAGAAGLSPF